MPGPLVPSRRFPTAEGVSVAGYDLGGGGPPLLLAHATGFCAAVLAPLGRHLTSRFHPYALDERAHGLTDPPPGDDFDWHGFARDVLAVVDGFGLDRPYGFGHSCGGAALLLAEEARPGTFSGLYVYEPVVYPGDPPLEPTLENNPLSAGALRRRETFGSREEALANFSAKAPFDLLDPEVLAAYVDSGFRTGTDGGVHLRCDRRHEALVYANGFSHDAFRGLPQVGCPVTLACGADTDAFGPSFLDALADRLPRATTVVLPGLGHFGPLQDPAAVAASVLADTPGP